MPDKREPLMTVEQYQELMVASYTPITLRLMAAVPGNIRTHNFNVEKVITKSNLLDARSVRPSMFSGEMTDVNHAKFYPVSSTFTGVGMYLGFRTSTAQSGSAVSNHNAILNELLIGYDQAALCGAYGNKGLLVAPANDPLRIAMASKALPARSGDWETRAKAAKDLGAALKTQVDGTTAAESLELVVFGDAMQAYMSDTNSATDATSLYDHLRKGFGTKLVRIIEVPSLVLKGSALENQSGIAVVSVGMLSLDTVGYPDIDKVGVDDNEAGDFDWTRFKIGSVQFAPAAKGAIINQPLTISA